MTATPAWLASIEALWNRGIAGSAQAAILAQRLDGTAIRIDIEGLTAVRAGIANGSLALTAVDGPDVSPTAADATISGSPLALAALVRGAARDMGTSAAVQVRGDAEIANSYRQLFARARPDLEEEMSRVIGDLPARRLSQLAVQTLTWARRARRTARENVAEYLKEESRDLVNNAELREFLQGVDEIREMADRIEARLTRLEQRPKGAP